jgi:hypothetical protein
VAPIGYAVKGGRLAVDLWRYKSGGAGGAESAGRLRAMLADYLRVEGESLWAAAGMGVGPGAGPEAGPEADSRAAGPGAVAVVPSGRGRPGGHPLVGLVRSCIDVPLVRLTVAPERAAHVRGVDPGWLRVEGPVAGADLLVVDDSWVSGGSAQSAAVALKLAGARRVAIIVIGRHVNPDDPRSAEFLAELRRAGAGAGAGTYCP